MQDYDLIQVLWVEDDPKVTETYPLKAETFGLELVSFLCWDDAKEALEDDFNRWSAIILDAKCKYHRGSEDNTIVFLREALKDISVICERNGRIIPWYILTGGDDKTDVSDSINDDRMKWDADWTKISNKKYYSKNVDNEVLYERIKLHAQKSPRIQIIEMYRNTYKQLMLLNKDACDDILTILEAMHFPNSHIDFTPRLFYNPIRKALEYVFRLAGENGIIPDVFFSGGNVNLNQCFMFLIGRDAEKLRYRYGASGERVTPRHIHDMMSLIINLGNSNSHSIEQSHFTELSEEEIQKFEAHIKEIGGNSRFLVYSMALQFCEILQWMNNYIHEHPDREMNLNKCVKLESTNEMVTISPDEFVGIVKVDNKIYHIGNKFGVNSGFVIRNGLVGKKVKIVRYGENTDEKAKELYPYFASVIQPLE